MAGVAKLLDSPSHFSKFEIFREPQLNKHLKGMQKQELKIREIIFIENIQIKIQNTCIEFRY